MNEIIIRTQAQFDSLPHKFATYTKIILQDTHKQIDITKNRENSSIVASENSDVVAWEYARIEALKNASVVARECSRIVARQNARVVAWEQATIEAWDNSSVVARENASVAAHGSASITAWEHTTIEVRDHSSVVARENARVAAHATSRAVVLGNSRVVAHDQAEVLAEEKSRVVAWDTSRVEAREKARVVAWGKASVEAWENSSIVAREQSKVVTHDQSSVVAWDFSSVEAWGTSSVEAWENSSIKAREQSKVEAWGKSKVEAWGNVEVHRLSNYGTITLFFFYACWAILKGNIIKKQSNTAAPKITSAKERLEGWLKREGLASKTRLIVYKKVSNDFKTQENTKNETLWAIGTEIRHSNYRPETDECGEGKFHACARPYFCDDFRNEKGDQYIAIEVKKSDLYAWNHPFYPHKIAFGEGRVLFPCDKYGNKIPIHQEAANGTSPLQRFPRHGLFVAWIKSALTRFKFPAKRTPASPGRDS